MSCLTLEDWRDICTQDALRIRDLPKDAWKPVPPVSQTRYELATLRQFKTNYKLDMVLKEHLDGQKFSSLPK